jgi:hypothetical protein
MSKNFRRPSPALVISIIALFLAASGSAVAASKLVSGNSVIKVNSLSGNRLKSGSVTGKQIAVSTLGKVPSAAKADTATSATTATSAMTATSATTAGSAPISSVTYVTTSATVADNYASPAQAVTASCPTGTAVLGGGATVSDETYGGVTDSSPSGKTAWTAHIYNGNGVTLTATVTAICAPAAATAP